LFEFGDAPFYRFFDLLKSDCFALFRRISRNLNQVRHSMQGARIRHFSRPSFGQQKAQDFDQALESRGNVVGFQQPLLLRRRKGKIVRVCSLRPTCEPMPWLWWSPRVLTARCGAG
jgi:hypothetical protein